MGFAHDLSSRESWDSYISLILPSIAHMTVLSDSGQLHFLAAAVLGTCISQMLGFSLHSTTLSLIDSPWLCSETPVLPPSEKAQQLPIIPLHGFKKSNTRLSVTLPISVASARYSRTISKDHRLWVLTQREQVPVDSASVRLVSLQSQLGVPISGWL